MFRRERERIFATHWCCAGRAAEVANSGDFVLRDVAGESLILVRMDRREVRGHYNVCRHRGTRICTTESGRFDSSIRCSYHGWTYGLDGRLIAAPNMSDVEGFDAEDFPLHQVAVTEWQGFLFVHLGDDPPQIDPVLAPLSDSLAAWNVSNLVSAHQLTYEVAANWKLLFQNFNECYHCPRIHPRLTKLTPYRSATNDFEEGPILGGPMELDAATESLTIDGRHCGELLVDAAAPQSRQVIFYSIFPTLFVSLHPDYVLVHRVEPLAVDRTRVVCDFLFSPTAAEAPEFDPSPAAKLWDITNREDWRACERSQQGVKSQAYRPGPYSNLESIVAAWDRHYLRVTGVETAESPGDGSSGVA